MSDEWEKLFSNFLADKAKDLVEESLAEYFEKRRQQGEGNSVSETCSVIFDGMNFVDECLPLIIALQNSPVSTFDRCHDLLNRHKESLNDSPDLPVLRFRLSTLPPQLFKLTQIPLAKDSCHLVEFSGTVIKATNPRVLSSAKPYLCPLCKQTNVVAADPDQFYACPAPPKCVHCGESCSLKPIEVEDGTVYMPKDYQEIKLQEKLGSRTTIPRSIWVALDEDLVDSCKPGDDVRVIGVVIRRWQPLGKGPEGQTEIELAINANFIEVLNDQRMLQKLTEEQTEEFNDFWMQHSNDELEGRNKILASFCPQVYGLYTVKLALAIIMCGGVERSDPSGTRVRGESHMLMVGDPGTGKSQLLRYAAKLTPRSVFTSGIGSTNAGLTVSAVRDGNQWSLEAGALVLADGGVCCIDEFSSIREHDRVAIHEAMEQQSISVAKAGVVTRLHTRCSVLATANPKGKYDPEQPLTVNIGVASPLLSRFDLVFVLLDSKNPDWDEVVSSFILEGKVPMDEACDDEPSQWSFDKLQSYISYCRRINPIMGQDASAILSSYYRNQRRSAEGTNMARATVRLLQSCIRLAQGHARLVGHDEVTICDAVNAIVLLEVSFDSNPSFLAGVNPLHTAFPDDPTEEYKLQAEVILTGLGLAHLWDKEEERLSSPSSATKVGPLISSADSSIVVGSRKTTTALAPSKSRDANFSQPDSAVEAPSSRHKSDFARRPENIGEERKCSQTETRRKLKAFEAPDIDDEPSDSAHKKRRVH